MVFGVTAAMIVKDSYVKIFSRDCSECFGFGKIVCKHCRGTGVLDKTRGGKDAKAFQSADQLAVSENEYLCPFCQGDGVVTCKRCNGSGMAHSPVPNLDRLFMSKGPQFDRTIRLQKLKTKATELGAVASNMVKTKGGAGADGAGAGGSGGAGGRFSVSASDTDALPSDAALG